MTYVIKLLVIQLTTPKVPKEKITVDMESIKIISPNNSKPKAYAKTKFKTKEEIEFNKVTDPLFKRTKLNLFLIFSIL